MSWNSINIEFVNSLLGRNLLRTDGKYTFEILLQPTKKITETCNKFLIDFCPSGNVRDCLTKEEAAERIFSSESLHNARADGQISVFEEGKLNSVLIFENKLQDLFENQLKRHYELLLGISDKKDIENSLILVNYNSFLVYFKTVVREFVMI